MSGQQLVGVGDYSKHSSLNDVYDAFADLGNAKDFFYNWGGLNEWLFKMINGIRGEHYDAAMQVISKLADKMLFPYYLAALIAFVLLSALVQKIRKKGGIRPRLVMWFGIIVVLCVGFMGYAFITHTLKDVLSLPRPYVALPAQDVHLIEIRASEDAYHSFPSGHVGFITLMIFGLWPAFSYDWRWFTLLIIFAVAWSRVSLGVHFPADTVGAFLLIGGFTIVLRHFIYTIFRKLFGIHC
jgi:membrane-associated phospholipid phosphatase